MADGRHLGFRKFRIFNGWDAQEVELRLHAKFWRNRLKRGRDMAIFQFFLDFQKLEILTSGFIRRPNMGHRTKFRKDWSNRDMADFRYYKMAAAAILDFGKFNFLAVLTLNRFELRPPAKFW